MRKTIITIIMALIATMSFAQEAEPKMQTKKQTFYHGFYCTADMIGKRIMNDTILVIIFHQLPSRGTLYFTFDNDSTIMPDVRTGGTKSKLDILPVLGLHEQIDTDYYIILDTHRDLFLNHDVKKIRVDCRKVDFYGREEGRAFDLDIKKWHKPFWKVMDEIGTVVDPRPYKPGEEPPTP